MIQGTNGIIYHQKVFHERLAKTWFQHLSITFPHDSLFRALRRRKMHHRSSFFSIIFPLHSHWHRRGNEIITPHRVTGDRVHCSLFLICRHNTQVLDVWASTFAFEVPWNRRLFCCFTNHRCSRNRLYGALRLMWR